MARRFEVPEGKLLKLEVLLTAAITSGRISFVNLERLAGKCKSTSVAIPPASVYTYQMYKHIAKFCYEPLERLSSRLGRLKFGPPP